MELYKIVARRIPGLKLKLLQARMQDTPEHYIKKTLFNSAFLGLGLCFIAFTFVSLAENARVPVDNPATHLELTMIHEAMILEYAGPELALVTLGASMRLALLFSLIANLFFPWGIATSGSFVGLALGAVVLVGKTAVVALGISLIEIRSAKLRLFRLPELLAGGFVLSVLAVITGLVTR